MGSWHNLLRRQLKRHLGLDGDVPEGLARFVTAVDQAYVQFDNDREMLERSMELSSQELMAANAELKALLADLERRVDERTTELRSANRRLVREVAMRELAETRVRESEQMFRSMSSAAKDAIILIDAGGRITFCNDAATELFGYEAEEMLGKAPGFLLAESADLPRFVAAFPAFVATGDSPLIGKTLELPARRKDGTRITIEISPSAVRINDAWHVMGIVRDITLRKQSEEALRRAKEAAEDASRLKSSFLSMVSHELRTPMTSILGFAKLIQKTLEDPAVCDPTGGDPAVRRKMHRAQGNCSIIVSECERLTELIGNALDLAKLEAGKFVWRMETVSVPEIVARAVEVQAVLFQEKGLPCLVEVAPDLPLVRGDKDRLLQVLLNLLSNALKFTQAGDVTVLARLEGKAILVGVRDTGVGVPPGERETIFDEFTQLGDTLTDKPKGTGLGLPIARQIVEHHGGRIWVEATPGAGSTFYFTIPLIPHGRRATDRRGAGGAG